MPLVPMCEEHKLAGMEVFELAPSLYDSTIIHTGTEPLVQISFGDDGSDGFESDEDNQNLQTNEQFNDPESFQPTSRTNTATEADVVDIFAESVDPIHPQQHSTFHMCANHVEDNLLLTHKFGTPLREVFKQMVYAFTLQEKSKYQKEMAAICPAALTYCSNIESQLLFRADAKQRKYNVYTNQSTECLNWVFRRARKTSRLLLLKSIETWFLKTVSSRMKVHEARLNDGLLLSQYAQDVLCDGMDHVHHYKVVAHLDEHTGVLETKHSQFVVNLQEGKCSCKRYDDLGIPCIHARKFLLDKKMCVHNYVDSVFLTTSLTACYSMNIHPVIVEELEPMQGRKAPVFRVQPGRPKGKRMPSRGSKEAAQRRRRASGKVRKAVTCSSCQVLGHNSQTCPGLKVPVHYEA